MTLEAESVTVQWIESCCFISTAPVVRALKTSFPSPTKDTFLIALTDEFAEQDVSFIELYFH